MTVSVSASALQTNADTNINCFSSHAIDTAAHASASARAPARKAFVRSPYKERTVMLRVPTSMLVEFRARLDQYKREVAAGHDQWVDG
jgi:hypothetical protein